MTTLSELNAARALNKKAPLKSWKDSKAKLEAAINIEIEAAAANAPKTVAVAAKIVDVDKKSEKPKKAVVKATEAKQAEAVTKPTKAEKARATVNVAEIAKALGINAKVARAKVRRLNIDRSDVKAIRKALTK